MKKTHPEKKSFQGTKHSTFSSDGRDDNKTLRQALKLFSKFELRHLFLFRNVTECDGPGPKIEFFETKS